MLIAPICFSMVTAPLFFFLSFFYHFTTGCVLSKHLSQCLVVSILQMKAKTKMKMKVEMNNPLDSQCIV